ncbi:MAG: EAL domain-containing protein [Betaproteobacteria bacterium]|nr:EAL domain-containing protein [Betaproteobacteria bacterium]
MSTPAGAMAPHSTAPQPAATEAGEHETLLKYEAILQNASVGIAYTKDRVFQHANRAFEDLFGWGPGELAGQPGRVVWSTDADYAEAGAAAGPRLAKGESIEMERLMSHRSGKTIWCRLQARPVDPKSPATGGTIWIIEDVAERRQAVDALRLLNEELEQRVRERTAELEQTNARLQHEVEDRQQAEARAQHLALHDALTGLPNRRLLNDRLVQSLAQAKRESWQLAAMFIDLDRFKNINDTLGHTVGDEVLREMARRLTGILRESDTVARVGGDEFVAVISHAQPGDLALVTAKMMSELSAPFLAAGQELRISASIGVASYPADAEDPLKLLSQADAAMYHAKAHGRRNVQFYAAAMSHTQQERLRLENDLHHALARGQLELYYQPRIDLTTGAVASFEALIRWHHPVDGLIEPGVFIPIAEDSGLIMPIGDWVIEEACRQLTRWHEAGMPFASVSVNISARQFFDTRLPDRVRRALDAAGLDGSQLELEITESVLMANTGETQSVFAGLKALGVKLSIDDFGTGFSSLAYLKRFHVDNLKIDHSFVRDIGTDADDAAIVQAIVGLARSLQLRVIAEGVETREQLAFLSDCGCDEAQGFLFAKPLPVHEAQRIELARLERA